MPSWEFMYGLECEFPTSEMGRVFDFYQPLPKFTRVQSFSDTSSLDEKIDWLEKTSPSVPSKTPWLELKSQYSSHGILPPTIVRDDTGNGELIFAPVGSREELEKQIRFVHEFIGRGLLQATVSLPSNVFFTQDGASYLGWFKFLSERDYLEKHHYNFLKGPSQNPRGQFLREPFLGPLTVYKANRLRKLLKYQARGEWWDKSELDFLAKNVSSSKYVGSTVYRPDIAGPDRICLEIRDAHRNHQLLMERVRRVEQALQDDLGSYQKFSSLMMFSPQEDFLRLGPGLVEFIKKLFPVSVPQHLKEYPRVVETFETFHNFAYLLRDWNPWIDQLGGRLEDCKRVKLAQENYLKELHEIASSELSDDEKRGHVLNLVLNKVEEASLYQLFCRQERIRSQLTAPLT